ncbi:MAG: hypothetical protein KIT89_06160 [Microcella sp.]|uniref:hypothetical protein n=1 Tax=Microcella sp. TaxID=1913979 RepID=UPI0024CBEFDC|nr:hypothetical protein [Microcella sp.]UYN84742.1 MAG: hypothetical protein KIT89_06160 [Microcella sp.]
MRREEARVANRALDYANSDPYDEHSGAAQRFERTRDRDPFPEIPPALLNAADIADYVAATGMISPFDPNKLKTASYAIPLLGSWVAVDEKGKVRRGVIDRGEPLNIRRNSITYVTTEPVLRLPDYIGMRHNLKINHIYKGLLVGTGPLIDPGFVGRLSLPIHNLTQNDYEFHGGEDVVWVEFTKLSPNRQWETRPNGDFHRAGAYPPFPWRPRRDVVDYVNEATEHLDVPSSSVARTDRRSRQAEKTAKKAQKQTRLLTLGSVIAIILLTATVIAPLIAEITSRSNKQEARIEELTQTILILQDTVEDLRLEITDAEDEASSEIKPEP